MLIIFCLAFLTLRYFLRSPPKSWCYTLLYGMIGQLVYERRQEKTDV